jgi:hypothetical protein
MRGPFPRLSGARRARIWVLVALCPALASCAIRIDCATALKGIPTAQSLQAPDVAIAVVTREGHVFPKRLITRAKQHAIVWVADGESLSIEFKEGAPVRVECKGPICVAQPPSEPSGERAYEYGGTVTPKEGKPTPLDPKLEVVK